MEEISYKELQEATQDFSLSHLIGKGSHGCVYKALLSHDKLVAIKKSSLALQILQDNTKLENEINILSSLHHPNPYLVNSVGLSHDSVTHKKLLVMDFMPNGSLHDSLHNTSTPPSWAKRAQVALQVAKAIQFLHESHPCIVHRDIKSTNILFDANWNARVADFGLAVQLNESRVNSVDSIDSPSQPAGTIGYMDPCYIVPAQLSPKSDVYSFGVVLLEIVSCRRAIDVGMETASLVDWALSMINNGDVMDICDKRVMVPHNMERAIQNILNIAARCVSLDEKSRPTIKELVIKLEKCVFQQVRSSSWRRVFDRILMRTKRIKMATRVTTIRCAAHDCEVHDISRRKLSIRDVLADESQ